MDKQSEISIILTILLMIRTHKCRKIKKLARGHKYVPKNEMTGKRGRERERNYPKNLSVTLENSCSRWTIDVLFMHLMRMCGLSVCPQVFVNSLGTSRSPPRVYL